MINSSVQNAVLLLRELKTNPGVKLKDFCESKDLSLHYMEQIGRKLVKHKYIISKRGPGGGYTLKKEKVLLLELVSLFMPGKMTNIPGIGQEIRQALSEIYAINQTN